MGKHAVNGTESRQGRTGSRAASYGRAGVKDMFFGWRQKFSTLADRVLWRGKEDVAGYVSAD